MRESDFFRFVLFFFSAIISFLVLLRLFGALFELYYNIEERIVKLLMIMILPLRSLTHSVRPKYVRVRNVDVSRSFVYTCDLYILKSQHEKSTKREAKASCE